jgi:hypothetical protein
LTAIRRREKPHYFVEASTLQIGRPEPLSF